MKGRPFGWILLALVPASAVAEPPKLDSIAPLGTPRGVATEITIAGGQLAGNPRLIAPFPVSVEPGSVANPDPAHLRIKIVVAPEVAVGSYPVRVATDGGISNPLLFSVGQTPQVQEAEENDTPDRAQAIPTPVVVEGQAGGNDVDQFKFHGKKGQRFVVDAQCARVGSTIDPTLRLTTAGGRYVASAEDSPGLGTDALIAIVLPDDGEYVIELSDSRYQGGTRPVYRLVVGEVPYAEEVFPLGGRSGETVGFEFRGGTLPGLRVAAARLTGPGPFRLQIGGSAIGWPPAAGTPLDLVAPAPLAVSTLPELREPADPEAPPVRAVAPVVLNGRIDPAGDQDRYRLSVRPGDVLRIRVEASEYGSAMDGQLQVLGANDAVLATADDTTLPPAGEGLASLTLPDPSLNFTVPGSLNEVTLLVRDLVGRGGVGSAYRLVVEPVVPTFDLKLADAQVSIPRSGAANVAVSVARQGYNGPIDLDAADLPPGVTVRAGRIPEGQAVGVLSLMAAEDAPLNAAEVKVVGVGQGPSGPIRRVAGKPIVFARQGNLPTQVVPQDALAAATALPEPVRFGTPSTPVEVVHGYGGTVPIEVIRASGADGKLTATPLPLPPGVTAPPVNIAEKAGSGNATVNLTTQAPLGTFNIAWQAKGSVGGRDRTLAVPAVTCQVVRPAALELVAGSAEVKAGQTAEVKGKVVRRGPFKEPVTVRINGLPAGLKADPVTLAPDASEFALKLAAEPKAKPANATANVVLAFQVNKKDYSTPATSLAVKVVPAP